MLAVYTIVEASNYGWGSAHTLGFGGVAVALLAAFVVRQATAANPLIPLRVFRSRTVTVANLMQMLMVAGIFGMFFLGALYLQRVLRYDAIEVGLAFLPVALGIAALSLRLAAQLMMRFGAKPTLIGGLALVAAGLLVFRGAPANAAYVTDLLPAMLLLGVGAGLVFPALMTLAMSGATPEDSGLASGLVNTTQQVGGALGLAVLATLSTTRTGSLLAHGASNATALTDGYHLAFTIAAGLVLAAIAIGLVFLRPTRALEAMSEPADSGRGRDRARVPGAGRLVASPAHAARPRGGQPAPAGRGEHLQSATPVEDSEIAFDERGLVPCIVQDWRTGEVLTLAYMNAEALRLHPRERRGPLLQPVAAGAVAQGRHVRATRRRAGRSATTATRTRCSRSSSRQARRATPASAPAFTGAS